MKMNITGNWRMIPAVAAMLIVGACGDQMGQVVSVTGPDADRALSPQVAASLGKSGSDKADKKEKKEKKGPKVKAKKKNGQEKEYKAAVRKGKAKSGNASAKIGPEGGVLTFGEHTLYVPAGAVDRDTRFMLGEAEHRVADYAVLALDLHANRGRGRDAVDVGKAGFNVPVILCIGYSDVDDEVEAGDEAEIIWYRGNDQVMEAVDAFHNGDGQYCGELDHFSLWGLAWP